MHSAKEVFINKSAELSKPILLQENLSFLGSGISELHGLRVAFLSGCPLPREPTLVDRSRRSHNHNNTSQAAASSHKQSQAQHHRKHKRNTRKSHRCKPQR